MNKIISDMILFELLDYHIYCTFPAAQIRFPANSLAVFSRDKSMLFRQIRSSQPVIKHFWKSEKTSLFNLLISCGFLCFHRCVGDILDHAGQPGQDKASIDTLTRYAHACSIKKLYHWYNPVKSILRTYYVVTQLCTWFYNAAPGATVGRVVSFCDNSHVSGW